MIHRKEVFKQESLITIIIFLVINHKMIMIKEIQFKFWKNLLKVSQNLKIYNLEILNKMIFKTIV